MAGDNDQVLSKVPQLLLDNVSPVEDTIWAKLTTTVSPTERGCLLLLYINCLSSRVHDAQLKGRERRERVHFIPHNHAAISHHPKPRRGLAPFAVGTHFSLDDVRNDLGDSYQLPWHHVESIVGVYPETNHPNVYKNAALLLQARPDHPGVYCLSLDPTVKLFRVTWTDAEGMIELPSYELRTHRQVLLAYIYSLYCPPKGYWIKDGTMLLNNTLQAGPAVWDIQVDGHTYENCELIFSGRPSGRRTTVYRHKIDEKLAIIKDVYVSRPYDEKRGEHGFYTTLQSDGFIPGLLRYHNGALVRPKWGTGIVTASRNPKSIYGKLQKYRIIYLSQGQSLSESRSLKDTLMAFYDAVEVSRAMLERGILHRDLSPYNILMYPEHDEGLWEQYQKEIAEDKVVLIKDVLYPETKGGDRAMGMIIDLDRAAVLPGGPQTKYHDEDEQAIKELHGTPGFLARAVAAGDVLMHAEYIRMPPLTDKAREVYIRTYGAELYYKWIDDPSSGTVHGVPAECHDGWIRVRHRPEHDVESMFYGAAHTTLRAVPDADDGTGDLLDENEESYTRIDRLDEMLNIFYKHECWTERNQEDPRNVLFDRTVAEWESCLHPELAPVAPLLVAMAKQVFPEYARLKIQPPKEHLHEAFRRLLLDFIVNMEDPIPLRPGQVRDPQAAILKPRQPSTRSATITQPALPDAAAPVTPKAKPTTPTPAASHDLSATGLVSISEYQYQHETTDFLSRLAQVQKPLGKELSVATLLGQVALEDTSKGFKAVDDENPFLDRKPSLGLGDSFVGRERAFFESPYFDWDHSDRLQPIPRSDKENSKSVIDHKEAYDLPDEKDGDRVGDQLVPHVPNDNPAAVEQQTLARRALDSHLQILATVNEQEGQDEESKSKKTDEEEAQVRDNGDRLTNDDESPQAGSGLMPETYGRVAISPRAAVLSPFYHVPRQKRARDEESLDEEEAVYLRQNTPFKRPRHDVFDTPMAKAAGVPEGQTHDQATPPLNYTYPVPNTPQPTSPPYTVHSPGLTLDYTYPVPNTPQPASPPYVVHSPGLTPITTYAHVFSPPYWLNFEDDYRVETSP